MMIVTRKRLPRRTILRGAGVAIALPLLDAMVPAFGTRAIAQTAPRRFAAVYVPNGMHMGQWTPSAEGKLELTPILAPLAAVEQHVVVTSGLSQELADINDGGPHPRSQTAWLTGARAVRSENAVHAGISADQIAAAALGRETRLASLELAIESVDFMGTCAAGYSCVYNNTIAWRDATTPLPMENNPRAVFERLFGISESTDSQARMRLLRTQRSILDSVRRQAGNFSRVLGADDRRKFSEYLDAVRDVERRLQLTERQSDRDLPLVEKPISAPERFEDHVNLMFDLVLLAFQTDLTRVVTFLMSREATVRSYPEVGVSEAHHPLSHHSYDPVRLALMAKINVFHAGLFARFAEKLQKTAEGDGSLLDHSLLLYGAGMSDSHVHAPRDLPTLVVGGKALGIQGGRHVRYAKGTPQNNLYLSLLHKLEVQIDALGDSTGPVAL